jgi:tRNA (cytidine/uridine-2'-O-)-methyltransferase
MKLVEQAEEDIYLMFGKESTGIDKDILRNNLEKTVRIPTSANVRSLNLANCVSMLCYEYARQNKYKNLETSEPHKKL